MTKTIPLTQGKFAIVDDEDYPDLSKYRWYAVKLGNTYYARRHPLGKKGNGGFIHMHRIVAGTPKGRDTDHINGNGLDNRRGNLRVVTRRENQQNRHTRKTSKYPGVSWDWQNQKWRASIKAKGKQHNLGRYDDEETAGLVYAMACNAVKIGAVL